jgi:hypothetical protein
MHTHLSNKLQTKMGGLRVSNVTSGPRHKNTTSGDEAIANAGLLPKQFLVYI